MFRQPYWGEPSKKPPKSRKPRRILTPKDKLRDNIINSVIILGGMTFFFLMGSLLQHRTSTEAWVLALLILGIFLLIFGLNAWTNKVNNYLKADDLDEPKNPDKEHENNSPVQK